MHEVVDDILDQARGVWRFRRTAIALAWLGALLGWLVVLAWPDSYESSARVYVATSTPLRPLLQGISVEQDVDGQLNLVRESLLGRPELEAVARAADLDVHVKTPADRDALIESLHKSILIEALSPEGNENPARRSTDSLRGHDAKNPSLTSNLCLCFALTSLVSVANSKIVLKNRRFWRFSTASFACVPDMRCDTY